VLPKITVCYPWLDRTVRAVNDQGYPSRRAAVTTRHLQCHPNWLAPPEDRESRDELGAAGVPRGATMSTDSSAPVPGVHVREIPSGVRLISAVDTSTVAFLSEAQTGLPTTTYVRSWRDLTDHHPQSGDEGVGPPLAPRIWPNRCTATSRTVAARAGSSPSSPKATGFRHTWRRVGRLLESHATPQRARKSSDGCLMP
jgi:hypothetical protein